jgi:acetyl esterase/lipase
LYAYGGNRMAAGRWTAVLFLAASLCAGRVWAQPAPIAAPAADLPPLEAYGVLPSVSEVEISPDGSLLAILVGPPVDRQLQIRRVSDRKAVFVGHLGALKVRQLEWVGDHHLLVIRSTTAQPWGLMGPKREYSQVADLNIDTGKLIALMLDAPMNTIDSTPVALMLDGKPAMLVESASFQNERGVVSLFRVNLGVNNDATRLVNEGSIDTQAFVIGNDGSAVARSEYNAKTGQWTLKLHRGASWVSAYTVVSPVDVPNVDGLGRDGRSVLIRTPDENGWNVREVSLADGKVSDPIDAIAGHGTISDPKTHAAIGAVHATMDHSVYAFFDAHDQAVWNGIVKAFSGEQTTLESWSDDRKRVVVKVEGNSFGAAYHLVDLNTGKAEWLTDEYKDIPPEAILERRVIEYAAADGTKIPAYLTLPRGRAAKDLPLIVLTHGGPAARDDPGFDWWSQALASKGYAVLQPQYRGSTGFGLEHLEAGYGQWGRKMQTDLSDGVRDLVKQGVVDAKRVCIMGASYGGYAALAGAVFDPTAYRCAVDLAGPSDLKRFLEYEQDAANGNDPEVVRYWDRFMGAKKPGDSALDEISPAKHADKAAMPILIIQGQDDTVVPYAQSTEMADALKRAGKPVEFVTLKSEDHWLSRGETRLAMLQAAVAFLAKNNPAQ